MRDGGRVVASLTLKGVKCVIFQLYKYNSVYAVAVLHIIGIVDMNAQQVRSIQPT